MASSTWSKGVTSFVATLMIAGSSYCVPKEKSNDVKNALLAQLIKGLPTSKLDDFVEHNNCVLVPDVGLNGNLLYSGESLIATARGINIDDPANTLMELELKGSEGSLRLGFYSFVEGKETLIAKTGDISNNSSVRINYGSLLGAAQNIPIHTIKVLAPLSLAALGQNFSGTSSVSIHSLKLISTTPGALSTGLLAYTTLTPTAPNAALVIDRSGDSPVALSANEELVYVFEKPDDNNLTSRIFSLKLNGSTQPISTSYPLVLQTNTNDVYLLSNSNSMKITTATNYTTLETLAPLSQMTMDGTHVVPKASFTLGQALYIKFVPFQSMGTTPFNVKLEMDDGKVYTVSNKLLSSVVGIPEAFLYIPFPAALTPGSNIKKINLETNADIGTQLQLTNVSVGRFAAGPSIVDDSFFYQSSKNIDYPDAYLKVRPSELNLPANTVINQLELGIANSANSTLKLKKVFTQTKSNLITPTQNKTLYTPQNSAGSLAVLYSPNNDITIQLPDYTTVQAASDKPAHVINSKPSLRTALAMAGLKNTEILNLFARYLQLLKDSFAQNNLPQVEFFRQSIFDLAEKCDATADAENRIPGEPIPGTSDIKPGKVLYPKPKP